jgi:hypothetical protein
MADFLNSSQFILYFLFGCLGIQVLAGDQVLFIFLVLVFFSMIIVQTGRGTK